MRLLSHHIGRQKTLTIKCKGTTRHRVAFTSLPNITTNSIPPLAQRPNFKIEDRLWSQVRVSAKTYLLLASNNFHFCHFATSALLPSTRHRLRRLEGCMTRLQHFPFGCMFFFCGLEAERVWCRMLECGGVRKDTKEYGNIQ
jgi:hypothetical protein